MSDGWKVTGGRYCLGGRPGGRVEHAGGRFAVVVCRGLSETWIGRIRTDGEEKPPRGFANYGKRAMCGMMISRIEKKEPDNRKAAELLHDFLAGTGTTQTKEGEER